MLLIVVNLVECSEVIASAGHSIRMSIMGWLAVKCVIEYNLKNKYQVSNMSPSIQK